VNHPQPELHVDFEVFEGTGCPPNEYGFRHCESHSPLADLGCDEIGEPSDLLGALASYPIALCLVIPYLNTEEPRMANARMIEEGMYFFNVA
jgi:hypothetical protein